MHIGRFIRYLRQYFKRRQIDWTLQRGDLVVNPHWSGPIEIVDINCALLAAAVRLRPNSDAIVVWPLWSLRRAP
jgi:hypothetical protein